MRWQSRNVLPYDYLGFRDCEINICELRIILFRAHEERTRANDWDRSVDHIRAGGQNGCIQRPDTWLHPKVSRKCQISSCTAGAVFEAKQT